MDGRLQTFRKSTQTRRAISNVIEECGIKLKNGTIRYNVHSDKKENQIGEPHSARGDRRENRRRRRHRYIVRRRRLHKCRYCKCKIKQRNRNSDQRGATRAPVRRIEYGCRIGVGILPANRP